MFEKYLTKTGRLSCKQPQEAKNQWYIRKFQEVHGDTYDYSHVVYSCVEEKVIIVCRWHGQFLQHIRGHLQGRGCPECAKSKTKKLKQHQELISDFIKVHGNRYNYSSAVYRGVRQKITILCDKHGQFSQYPNDHLKGQGCPKCQHQNQNTLYVLKCLDTGLIKIGITNSLEKRVSGIGGNLQILGHTLLHNPRELEKELHKKYQKYRRFNRQVRNGGTEFFQLSETQISELIQNINSQKASSLL